MRPEARDRTRWSVRRASRLGGGCARRCRPGPTLAWLDAHADRRRAAGCAASSAPASARTTCSTSRATTTSACPPTPGHRQAAIDGHAHVGGGLDRLAAGHRHHRAARRAGDRARRVPRRRGGARVLLRLPRQPRRVTALSGPGALVVSDAANHASLVDACRLATRPHRRHPAPRRSRRRRCGCSPRGPRSARWSSPTAVNSVDGALAPLRELHAVCRAPRRAAGRGRGARARRGRAGRAGAARRARTGRAPTTSSTTVTLSKALGSQGGAVRRPGAR